MDAPEQATSRAPGAAVVAWALVSTMAFCNAFSPDLSFVVAAVLFLWLGSAAWFGWRKHLIALWLLAIVAAPWLLVNTVYFAQMAMPTGPTVMGLAIGTALAGALVVVTSRQLRRSPRRVAEST